jgi:hypothetical protein
MKLRCKQSKCIKKICTKDKMLFSFLLESSEDIDLNEDKLLRLKSNEEMLNKINLILDHIHKVYPPN